MSDELIYQITAEYIYNDLAPLALFHITASIDVSSIALDETDCGAWASSFQPFPTAGVKSGELYEVAIMTPTNVKQFLTDMRQAFVDKVRASITLTGRRISARVYGHTLHMTDDGDAMA